MTPSHTHTQCWGKDEEALTASIKEKRSSKRRTPLIELDHKFSCSIIGTCVTLAELRKIRHKAKLYSHETINEYDLHRIFVGVAEEKGYANKRLQKLLDQKYNKIIVEFARVNTQKDLSTLWKLAVEKGEVAGAFWALLTHPDIQQELLNKVYGDVHMLSHLSGASVRIDMQELTILRHESKRIKKQKTKAAQKYQRRLYDKEALIRKQDKQLAKLQQEINALKVASMPSPKPSTQSPNIDRIVQKEFNELSTTLHFTQSKLMRLEQKSAITFARFETLDEQKSFLQTELQQAKEENTNLEMLLTGFLGTPMGDQPQADSECNRCNLDGKCILYVGGRDRQCSHFRALVEHNNGHFIHHDGGKSDGSSKLYSTLAQADAVMCPLDCISHEAMINVKRHCKNAAKPLVMMPRSSLSAFSKGLSQVVN